MKQMKFFLVALMTLAMGMSVTSCMKGEDNNIVSATLPVKYDYTGFITGSGDKLVPASGLSMLDGNMYLISFQYDRTQVTDNKKIVVTLLTDPICIDPKYDERLTSSEVVATNPIYMLDAQQTSIAYYDKDTFVLPILFWVKKETDSDKQKAELQKHSFRLSYKIDDIKQTDTKLTLYVNHIVGDAEGETVERPEYTYLYKAYNINEAITAFKEKTKKAPQYLVLKAQTNRSEDKLKESNGESTAEFPYPFKEE